MALPESAFMINSQTISAHQSWRVYQIRNCNARVRPLIRMRNRLSLIDFNNIEQIFGIWSIDQVTRSLCKNWELYNQIYPEKVLIEAYNYYVINENPLARISFIDRRRHRMLVLDLILNTNNKSLLEIWVSSLDLSSTFIDYNLSTLENINKESFMQDKIVKLYLESTASNDTIRHCLEQISSMAYSVEVSDKLFLYVLLAEIYSGACSILIEMADDSITNQFTSDRYGATLLMKVGAPRWMIDIELSNHMFNRKGTSRELMRALRHYSYKRRSQV